MDRCLDLCYFFFFFWGGGGEGGVGWRFCFQIIFFVGGGFVFNSNGTVFFLFCGGTLLIFVQHSLTQFFSCMWGKCKCRTVCIFVLGQEQLNNCFWKIRVAFRRAGWCDLLQANLLICPDFAGYTGWEVLTVLDEWKMALVTVLVEVERVKMVVVF